MAAFNSRPVTTTGATTTNDAMVLASDQALGLDAFDPDVKFDDSLIDYVNGALPPLPFTPSYDLEPFSTFVDPFSYPATARLYEPVPDPDPARDESETREMDNKLLGFSAPILKAGLVNETGQLAEIMMTAELYGMFFVAEDVFEADNAATGRPLELTCYRRNLWQCSGQLTLPRLISHLIDEQGRHVPVIELVASITAIESIDGKTTEIISIPWKSSNPSATPSATTEEQAKVAGAPPIVPIDLIQAQEVDASRVTVAVSWKRLQFKHATANNGRRKGLQQHYVVQINLLAKTTNGDLIPVAEIHSGPVIVRGRSPRNFDSRRDVPLTGDKKVERRSTSATVSSGNGNNAASSDVHTPPKSEAELSVQNPQRYHSVGNIQQSTDWGLAAQGQQQPPHPTKRAATSPSISRPPVPSWTRESTGSLSSRAMSNLSVTGGRSQPATASMPLNLSLSEDERSPNKSSSDAQSPQLSKGNISGHDLNQSPMETADMLYEYFPLSLDDWSPPIDAIYRPHAAHHLAVLTDIKAQQISSKTKRYFSTDYSA